MLWFGNMDRSQLTARLAQAERHVELGQQHVERQSALIADLESFGYETTEAQRLLVLFQDLLAIYIGDRDRVRRELAQPR